MKRLILMRHGAAAWAENGLDDEDRPLTDVGRRESRRQAQWLDQQTMAPDHALVSGARRACETWERMRDALTSHPTFDIIEELYLAEPGTLLSHIETLPNIAATAIVVGHNPGMEMLARMLAGSDAGAMRDMTHGFPTAGLAVFEINTDGWEQASIAGTRLTHFARHGAA